jgi:hypothetical protein
MELLAFYWREIAFLVLLVGVGIVVIRRVWLLWGRALLFVLAPCFLVAIALNVLLIAFDWNATTYSSLSRSPTGSFVVRAVVWRGTAIDWPQAKIIIRRPGMPSWRTAYEGLWFGDENGGATPYISWAGPQQLHIEVPSDYYTSNECKSPLDGVKIDCEPQKETR